MMMKRLLLKLMVGLAAFLIGLSTVSIRHAPPPMSLCELDANPAAYKSKTVRFRAIVERRRSAITEKEYNFIYAYSFCDNINNLADVSVDLDASEAAKLPLEEVHTISDANHLHLVDAVIVGQLDPYFKPGCFGPKYNISNARVERIFSTQNFEDFELANKWIRANSY
jgi:hypothetical protein